jgi:hypothetical protein
VSAPAAEYLLPPPSEAALASSRARTYFDPSSAASGKLNFTIGQGTVVTADIKAVSIIVRLLCRARPPA